MICKTEFIYDLQLETSTFYNVQIMYIPGKDIQNVESQFGLPGMVGSVVPKNLVCTFRALFTEHASANRKTF